MVTPWTCTHQGAPKLDLPMAALRPKPITVVAVMATAMAKKNARSRSIAGLADDANVAIADPHRWLLRDD
jgi:hypothetical protein